MEVSLGRAGLTFFLLSFFLLTLLFVLFSFLTDDVIVRSMTSTLTNMKKTVLEVEKRTGSDHKKLMKRYNNARKRVTLTRQQSNSLRATDLDGNDKKKTEKKRQKRASKEKIEKITGEKL
tara:strand:- start:126 stop:485 length:360 start_codon:yes stop_codon:yes gene_type:complete